MKRNSPPNSVNGRIDNVAIHSGHPANSPRGYVVVVPGYSETITHNKALVGALATEGFETVSFTQPYPTKSQPSPVESRIDAVRRVIEATVPAGEKIYALAHSLGALPILALAKEHPEQFARIVLMQPAGFVDSQGLAKLSTKTTRKIVRNQSRALNGQTLRQPSDRYVGLADQEGRVEFFSRTLRAQLAAGGVLARRPKLALREAHLADRYDVDRDIAEVMAGGVPVDIVLAHGDELFDSSEAYERYPKIAHHIGALSVVADSEAGHDTTWLQPRRTATLFRQIVEEQHS